MSDLVRYLSEASGLYPSLVREVIGRAHLSYKWYRIPKRNGDYRQIAQPAREVKVLQRLFVDRMGDLPVHVAAKAYRKGQSIRDNAVAHAAAGPVLKLDFSEFFPSIRSSDWVHYATSRDLMNDEDLELSTKLLFVRYPNKSGLRLAIGAPSSPWLSNVLMANFDDVITRLVAKDKVTYTRYADDLTFSAHRTGYLTGVEKTVRGLLRETHHPRLQLNESKTVLITQKYRRTVTGLVLANDGRVTIGRERKRIIRSALHRYSAGGLDEAQQAKLAGYLAHVRSVEPSFFNQVTARYGNDLLARLMHPLLESKSSIIDLD